MINCEEDNNRDRESNEDNETTDNAKIKIENPLSTVEDVVVEQKTESNKDDEKVENNDITEKVSSVYSNIVEEIRKLLQLVIKLQILHY